MADFRTLTFALLGLLLTSCASVPHKTSLPKVDNVEPLVVVEPFVSKRKIDSLQKEKFAFDFVITETGKVAELELIESNSESYNSAVIKALKLWKFRPFLVNGKPGAVRATYTLYLRNSRSIKLGKPCDKKKSCSVLNLSRR